MALSKGMGKNVCVVVLCVGDNIVVVKVVGVDFVGDDDLVDEIVGGMMDFDLFVVISDMMSKVVKFGR